MKTASHRLVKLLKEPASFTNTVAREKPVEYFVVNEELDSVDGQISIEENDELNQISAEISENANKEDTNAGVSKPLLVETIDGDTKSVNKPKEEYILNHLKDLIDEVKQFVNFLRIL
ncbi:uncharacterized protein LOC132757654 [Ruditapes philippinarum]|uniref:uncharacterized protein LOC132757654 n=1 Tax=Ruditapes philippinarum TaxID=129788 RepID=UPI00295B1DB9|nr:uncharacterized protein LOC132757654 [Ruditapes philippinarum]